MQLLIFHKHIHEKSFLVCKKVLVKYNIINKSILPIVFLLSFFFVERLIFSSDPCRCKLHAQTRISRSYVEISSRVITFIPFATTLPRISRTRSCSLSTRYIPSLIFGKASRCSISGWIVPPLERYRRWYYIAAAVKRCCYVVIAGKRSSAVFTSLRMCDNTSRDFNEIHLTIYSPYSISNASRFIA